MSGFCYVRGQEEIMYINTFQYKPEDVDCKLCTECRKKTGCAACGCPWLAERIEAGAVGYGEAVSGTFRDYPAMLERLRPLIRLFPGTLWRDEGHRQRMESVKARLGYRRHRDTPAFHAALYLLTADEDTYARAANCFCKHGIEFGYARLRGVSPHGYALYMAARGICTGAEGLTVRDLADGDVVDPEAFRLIVNAVLIARYGPTTLNLRERGRTV